MILVCYAGFTNQEILQVKLEPISFPGNDILDGINSLFQFGKYC
jgi:hypothetical protein